MKTHDLLHQFGWSVAERAANNVFKFTSNWPKAEHVNQRDRQEMYPSWEQIAKTVVS